CDMTNSSKERSRSERDSTRRASSLAVWFVPQSISSRWVERLSPYSIQMESPFPAGSISTSKNLDRRVSLDVRFARKFAKEICADEPVRESFLVCADLSDSPDDESGEPDDFETVGKLWFGCGVFLCNTAMSRFA